ncbi:hypothetical protein BDQ17DRAFT_1329230 [Cyathus striatus]|nr:hypothetical protein BDQ17DRAFT_1329230 [Cyathus striatus]
MYADAAQEEVDYITTQAPCFWNGAISHRVQYPKLWADFVYMAPPFLAYHAAVHNNITLLQDTVTQLQLYRQILKANTTSSSRGVWEHIIGPMNFDPGLWSTGNAWEAVGMTRVLTTVLKALIVNKPSHLIWRAKAVHDISLWMKEILEALES